MKMLVIALIFLVFTACVPQTTPIAPTIVPSLKPTPFAVNTPTKLAVQPTPLPVITIPTPIIITPTPMPDYIVRKGDTLIKIAGKYGVSVIYLADLNGINNPGKIKVGQKLKVSGIVEPPAAPISQGKVILVILGRQRVYVYEDGVLIKEFIVSTGRARHKTVTGTFRVQAKFEITRMVGPDYDVMSPWTEYFGNPSISWHKGYSLHGAPWNHDLGTPHSHGCVNMAVEDAKWLFDWTDPVQTGSLTLSENTDTGTLIVITE